MKAGIIGLPESGKTTIFNLLTGEHKSSGYGAGQKTNIGVAMVPDKRLERLAEIYKPKKITHAHVELMDLKGLKPGESRKFLEEVRGVDALMLVVRQFADESILHIKGKPDPVRDYEDIKAELIIEDLSVVEQRIEKRAELKKKGGKMPGSPLEDQTLEKCRAALDESKPLISLDLREDELESIRHYNFLTFQPTLVVVNLDEEQWPDRDKLTAPLMKVCAENKDLLVPVCGKMEEELIDLDPEEAKVFLEDMGLEEPARNRVIQEIYNALGYISFLTGGPDEVRAWPIHKGATAHEAAGQIHSDIQRGFIRAEVTAYSDLDELGSEEAVKAAGKIHSERKEYIVKDGDEIYFKFNV